MHEHGETCLTLDVGAKGETLQPYQQIALRKLFARCFEGCRKALITPIGGYGYPCATLGRLPRNGRPLANRPLIENCDIDRWLKFRSNARGAFDIRILLIAPFAETKRRTKVIG